MTAVEAAPAAVVASPADDDLVDPDLDVPLCTAGTQPPLAPAAKAEEVSPPSNEEEEEDKANAEAAADDGCAGNAETCPVNASTAAAVVAVDAKDVEKDGEGEAEVGGAKRKAAEEGTAVQSEEVVAPAAALPAEDGAPPAKAAKVADADETPLTAAPA